jgi:hypothetical protein
LVAYDMPARGVHPPYIISADSGGRELPPRHFNPGSIRVAGCSPTRTVADMSFSVQITRSEAGGGLKRLE